jgi:sugar phosphate permease
MNRHNPSSQKPEIMSNRRWLVLLPVIFVTYSLAYLDRANYSFGAAAGMAADLRISSAASSFLGALFFLGYFAFQIPGAIYAQRKSIKRLVFAGLILWGLLAGATGIISDLRLLYADRFLLGVVESAVLPALLILLARWFTAPERARVSAILILGNPVTLLWMSVLSGYLANSLGWRGMFVAEGVPPILWAFVWWRLVADRPSEARWVSDAERLALEAQLAAEQQRLAPVRDYRAAFRSPVVILLAAQYFFWSIGVYGFVLWLPSILKMHQTGIVAVGWLSAIPYLAAVIAMLIVSTFSDRLRRRKHAIWPFLLLGALAFYASYAFGMAHFWFGFGALVVAGAAMYAPYGPFFAYMPEVLPTNVAGGAIALVNGMGALGSFTGTYAVGLLNGLTGNPDLSYIAMAVALIISTGLTLLLPERRAGIG